MQSASYAVDENQGTINGRSRLRRRLTGQRASAACLLRRLKDCHEKQSESGLGFDRPKQQQPTITQLPLVV
jgi:hypothetical protein